MPDARTPVASALPPATRRNIQAIEYDIVEATSHLDGYAEDLKYARSQRDRDKVIARMRREIIWLGEVLEEFEAAPL